MKYTKSIDIWKLNPQQIACLQPGQWVYAGEPTSKGRFFGVKKSGSVVVGWHGNTRKGARRSYYRTLREYATSWRDR
jgi:hypothetical protein